MRNLDLWNRYLDNNGKILQGCIQVNVKDGNTVADIYDSDGSPLQNPQLTDEYGRSENQIFIDEDVVVYFYKYIGTGSFANIERDSIDTSDATLWSLQYTAENTVSIGLTINSDTPIAVGNIQELRNIDPEQVPIVGGKKIIQLLGYYEAGDKSPVEYIWYENSSEDENGGSIIAGQVLTGRWKMVATEVVLDVRHFGIFPASSASTAVSSGYSIQNATTYANSVGLKLWFPKYTSTTPNNIEYKYYRYNNLNITVRNGMIFDDGVVLIDSGTESFISTLHVEGNPLFNNYNTNLTTDVVKVSWNAKTINAKTVIMDSEVRLHQSVFSNVDFYLDASLNSVQANFTNCRIFCRNGSINTICTFTACEIHSNRNISTGSYFYKCKLDEEMFYGSPYIHVDAYCMADINDFKNKQTMWLNIMSQQAAINYDWQGLLTSQQPWYNTPNSDRWLINYKGGGANNNVPEDPDHVHVYYFENCAGQMQIEGKQANTYIFKNCEIALTFKNGYNTGISVVLKSSEINITQERINLQSMSIRSSSIGGSGSIDAAGFYSYDSILNCDVHCGYADVKDSNIGGKFQIYGLNGDAYTFQEEQRDSNGDPVYDPQTGTIKMLTYTATRFISANIINNFVSGQIEVGTIDAKDPHLALDDLVRGFTVMNNVGLSEVPIVVRRSITNIYDEQNIYVYKGNTGSFPGHNVVQINTASGGSYTTVGASGSVGVVYHGRIDNWVEPYSGNTGHTDPNMFMCRVQCFSIGTMNVRFKMKTAIGNVEYHTDSTNPSKQRCFLAGTTTILDTVERSKQEYSQEAGTQTPWPKSLTFDHDFTWKITYWPVFLIWFTQVSSQASDLNYVGPMEIDAEPVQGAVAHLR